MELESEMAEVKERYECGDVCEIVAVDSVEELSGFVLADGMASATSTSFVDLG
jgi:hypothetical protein